ncbi:carboxylic ester hydrolase [Stylonychia lemnae]|uniref:Lipase n=1 Tax=Stylonychia lemnae TaxID=5949 RepID=A0A078BAN4_STYLE|nr:carboxylic ester hydrolase [Stylonychia lemnae]|eukprot:CDW91414.1 carboxylic ester hydrolase [Stylonychia lemnae]
MGLAEQLQFFLGSFAQFVLYWSMNQEYRTDVLISTYKFSEALFQDFANILNIPDKPEQYGWPIDQQIIEKGYMYEQHKITTEDGFILTAFRIPGRFIEKQNKKKKQPVYMQHGLIDDAGTWFFNNNVNIDLSFQLADLGYDVWLTNSRGTVYSNQHRKFTTSDSNFWEFTLHEMGQYDVPANLNYIMEKTGFDQVIYIGHSQGTTQWFIANSLYWDIHKHFKVFIGVAPVMFIGETKSVAAKTLDLLKIPDFLYEFLDHVLYLPNLSGLGQPLLRTFPRSSWMMVQSIVGYDDKYHIDLATLPMMAINDVGGTSTKNMLHWIQMLRSKRFCQFDYGKNENMKKYGEPTPPNYDVYNFKEDLKDIKMLLFYGQRDTLLDLEDYEKLKNVLPDHAKTIYIEDYNHVDYMWAEDSNEFVNKHIVEFLKSIE